MKSIKLKNFTISNNNPFVLFAGPCAIENYDHACFMAEKLKFITSKYEINLIYKSSFNKANRSSKDSARGVGISKGLEILNKIKLKFDLPILTDVHEISHVDEVAEVADVLQIPAFLCRQTDLVLKVAETCKSKNKIIKIKKGQFLAPWDTKNIIEKIEDITQNIILTERGTSFGYNTLVNDFTGLHIMKNYQYPVVFDATHSVQKPGGLGKTSGGNREYVPVLAKASLTVGIAGIFMEVHQDPDTAPSDGANMVKLENLGNILSKLKQIDNLEKLP